MAVIAFPGGEATLPETAPGVSVEQILIATEANLSCRRTFHICSYSNQRVKQTVIGNNAGMIFDVY